ncbi:DUF1801 domain-containing protein [uncultured Flavobacterium sp.]|uniref:DUF1801 domain-containing protein n=1 Tax=uncultured Flavobacterium sp. TaxID=165435 RepID=UPI0025CBA087|nr:DUF1801 domain-containing protein [uncultured Flavobacterium sp.]
MQSSAVTVNEYIEALPEDRKAAMQKLREVINASLPEGFEERISYGMIGWVVPHSTYAPGYHCDPKLPLPFLSIASQKNFIAVYHMGMYASNDLLDWFTAEYPKHVKTRLDMGKSCIRFKKPEAVPFELIGELASKMKVADWIALYEKNLKG